MNVPRERVSLNAVSGTTIRLEPGRVKKFESPGCAERDTPGIRSRTRVFYRVKVSAATAKRIRFRRCKKGGRAWVCLH